MTRDRRADTGVRTRRSLVLGAFAGLVLLTGCGETDDGDGSGDDGGSGPGY